MTEAHDQAGSLRPEERRRRLTAILADASGATQGQISTVVVSMLLAATLSLGIPPVLRNRQAVSEPQRSTAPSTDAVAGASVAPPSTPEDAAPLLPAFPDATPPTPLRTSVSSPDASSPASSPAADRPVAPPVGSARVFARAGATASPDGVAVGPDGLVYVAFNDANASRVERFVPTGEAVGAWTVTGQPQAGHRLTGVALDGRGGLLALDAATGRVLRFDLVSGGQSTYAELFDLPACQLVVVATEGCEPGVGDDGPAPRALALDAAGALYVTDAAQGTIWRVPTGGGKAAPFYSDRAFAAADGLDGIAVDPDGALIVASPQATDPSNAGGGALFRLKVANGAPGVLSLFARFDPGQAPAGVALLDNGSVVVTLRDADAVALLGPTGAEERRVGGTVGDVVFDAPAGVAFHGRTLLVANRSPKIDDDRAVLAVGIR